MRKRTWVEILVGAQSNQSFKGSDRVVSVRVKNQGTANALTGWNTEGTPNIILPNTSDTFDAGDSAYMEGDLKISFGAVGNASVLLLVLKDSIDNCD